MKKNLLVIIAVIVVAFFSCGKDTGDDVSVDGKSIVGTWEIIKSEFGELDSKGGVIAASVQIQDYSKDKYINSVDFKANGTGIASLYFLTDGDNVEKKWIEEKEEFRYILDGSTLALSVKEEDGSYDDPEFSEVSWSGENLILYSTENDRGKVYFEKTTLRKK